MVPLKQVSFAGFPYGNASITPFSYQVNSTTGNLTMKNDSDIVWEPFFAFAPPTLLIKAISDMGTASAKVWQHCCPVAVKAAESNLTKLLPVRETRD